MLTAKKDPQKSFTLLINESECSTNNETQGTETGVQGVEEENKKVKVTVKKGKSLIDLVEPILETNGISFETHSLFLESSNTPLPLNGDTIHYGGTTLYVRENEKIDIDKRIISLMKGDGIKKISSTATKRFSELLEQYNMEKYKGDNNELIDLFKLEGRWQDVITEKEDMTTREKVQQESIWELFTTEIKYIDDLRVITEVFQNCFNMIQDGGCMIEVDGNLIFANIGEIYDVNVTFWKRLKEVIDNARVSKQPIRPSLLVKPFQGFEELFQPYIQFCNADTSNRKLPEYSPSTNDMIRQFSVWCDSHERCKRISMNGFLIKPLQRVTKYSLLLKAILNKTDDETERAVLDDVMSRVETFVSKINTAVHLRQEQEKLDSVILRLHDYIPVEAVTEEAEQIIKENCNLNLNGRIPGLSSHEKRFILKEGWMKLVEKQGKKEIYAFLFSDVFVITKLKRNIDKYRIFRPPYRLNKVRMRELKDPGQLLFMYMNEYGVLANAFILQVTNSDEQSKWRIALQEAKEKYELVRTEYSLREQFWDDDPPISSLSKNKILSKKAATSEKLSLTSFEDGNFESVGYGLRSGNSGFLGLPKDALTAAGVAVFIAINLMISRYIGLLD